MECLVNETCVQMNVFLSYLKRNTILGLSQSFALKGSFLQLIRVSRNGFNIKIELIQSDLEKGVRFKYD